MFSQTVEYALRGMVYLAAEAAPRTVVQISAATQVPAPYLAKVLQQLAKADLIHGQRGRHGGFTLRIPATTLTIWSVINAVEPLQRIRTCPLGLQGHRTRLCPLHKKLDDALAATEAAFKLTTLAELLGDPDAPRPLCDEPAAGRRRPLL